MICSGLLPMNYVSSVYSALVLVIALALLRYAYVHVMCPCLQLRLIT